MNKGISVDCDSWKSNLHKILYEIRMATSIAWGVLLPTCVAPGSTQYNYFSLFFFNFLKSNFYLQNYKPREKFKEQYNEYQCITHLELPTVNICSIPINRHTIPFVKSFESRFLPSLFLIPNHFSLHLPRTRTSSDKHNTIITPTKATITY